MLCIRLLTSIYHSWSFLSFITSLQWFYFLGHSSQTSFSFVNMPSVWLRMKIFATWSLVFSMEVSQASTPLSPSTTCVTSPGRYVLSSQDNFLLKKRAAGRGTVIMIYSLSVLHRNLLWFMNHIWILYFFVYPVCPTYQHPQEAGCWEVSSDRADLLSKLQGDGENAVITHFSLHQSVTPKNNFRICFLY